MDHWKVDWLHDCPSDPVTLYSEIGPDGYEVRKVERYADGRSVRADALHESDEIGLGQVPVGSLADVNAQPEFRGVAISREEFEKQWRTARWPLGPNGPACAGRRTRCPRGPS
ncbi:hypothetical protein QFZ63_003231 [Streptomyces sp. B3I7]|jgi:hypothetical protein|uniref:DUF6881 domain-containing protein n=1 Tax=unclassified Streptomyces TaxID=2593676 RepID=UPI0027842FB9|nr:MULTISPECIES: hypothetical protein [unclassified Streptomyces]MDQ0788870.1 hypothetical protein [Streptomyces sp. B3I8]MDQ0811517.1 hypothetical protein [Streptomyces sp. B3I7]